VSLVKKYLVKKYLHCSLDFPFQNMPGLSHDYSTNELLKVTLPKMGNNLQMSAVKLKVSDNSSSRLCRKIS